MKRFMAAGLLSLLSIGAAFAQATPAGDWLVEDGTARIRLVQCSGAYWGVISWTKDAPGKDENNPNPALRNRSVLGIPILIDMKPAGTRWEGQVYNAQDGSTYKSNISLLSPNVLKIEGCVLGGIFCGGENWTRQALPKNAPSDHAVCSGLPK
jgi:uncharacterized protein (DUF2147 family)